VVGGSWEGFVIEQLPAHLPKANAYYWRTQAGAELDLLLFLKGRRIGIEIKRADAPKMTRSMGSALEDLELQRLLVVYPGSARYTLRSKVEVMSLAVRGRAGMTMKDAGFYDWVVLGVLTVNLTVKWNWCRGTCSCFKQLQELETSEWE
jgi:hypothetical protein